MAKVFGMHALELQPGCDENELEEFMRKDFLPSYSRVSGQTAHLLKGDRGERAGKYLVLIELESPERRDRIYPSEGGVSDDVVQLVGDIESLVSTVRSFLVEFPDPRYTDYVMVSDS
jgi:hypothetical protein